MQWSIFISYRSGINEIISYLTEITGIQPLRETLERGDIYTIFLTDKELIAFDNHGLEDDFGISFTSFDVELDIVPLTHGSDNQYQEIERTAIDIAEKIYNRLKTNVIVVKNLQNLIISFSVSTQDPLECRKTQ